MKLEEIDVILIEQCLKTIVAGLSCAVRNHIYKSMRRPNIAEHTKKKLKSVIQPVLWMLQPISARWPTVRKQRVRLEVPALKTANPTKRAKQRRAKNTVAHIT